MVTVCQDKRLAEWMTQPEYISLLEKAYRMTGHKYFASTAPQQAKNAALVMLQQQMEIETALHMPVFANEGGLRFTLEVGRRRRRAPTHTCVWETPLGDSQCMRRPAEETQPRGVLARATT
jgi:hypothetical protein